MKSQTTAIYNTITKTDIEEMFFHTIEGNGNINNGEEKLFEYKESFIKNIETLKLACEDGTFDNLPPEIRNHFVSTIAGINNALLSIHRYQYVHNGNSRSSFLNLFTNLNALKALMLSSGLDKLNDDELRSNIEELNFLRKKYKKIISEYKELDDFIESKNKNTDQINQLLKKSTTLLESVDNINKLSNKFYEELKIKHSEFNDTVKDIESRKTSIISLHSATVGLQSTIESSKTLIDDLSTKTTKNFEEKIGLLTSEADKVIEEASNELKNSLESVKSMRIQVNELLQGVNAGRLFESFRNNRIELEKGLNLWFWGVILINILIVGVTFIMIFGCNPIGILPIGDSTNGIFFIKLFISLPLIVLDFFFISEYNKRRNLIEKYNFKSAISLSLLAYNEMIKENSNNQDAKDFLNNSIEKIFESPFETYKLNRKDIELLNKYADKGFDKIADYINKK